MVVSWTNGPLHIRQEEVLAGGKGAWVTANLKEARSKMLAWRIEAARWGKVAIIVEAQYLHVTL